MNPKNGVGMSAEPVVPPNDEKEIRALLRAWDNDAGRLNRADVESLAEWIHAHDYRRARPALPAPEPPPDVLDMFTRRLEVLARERSWVSNHDTRLVCEAAVGVLRAILGAALPAEHAPPDPIRILGDPILRRVAQPWAGDPGALTSRLERTMRAAGGVGLAAPQIGESVRVAVIAVSDRFVLQMVNPLIVWQSEETATELEGCLSIPGYEVPITRPVKITVDVGSNVVTLEGIQARAAQHEIDHLDGILILDRWLAQTAGIVSGSRPALAGRKPTPEQ